MSDQDKRRLVERYVQLLNQVFLRTLRDHVSDQCKALRACMKTNGPPKLKVAAERWEKDMVRMNRDVEKTTEHFNELLQNEAKMQKDKAFEKAVKMFADINIKCLEYTATFYKMMADPEVLDAMDRVCGDDLKRYLKMIFEKQADVANAAAKALTDLSKKKVR